MLSGPTVVSGWRMNRTVGRLELSIHSSHCFWVLMRGMLSSTKRDWIAIDISRAENPPSYSSLSLYHFFEYGFFSGSDAKMRVAGTLCNPAVARQISSMFEPSAHTQRVVDNESAFKTKQNGTLQSCKQRLYICSFYNTTASTRPSASPSATWESFRVEYLIRRLKQNHWPLILLVCGWYQRCHLVAYFGARSSSVGIIYLAIVMMAEFFEHRQYLCKVSLCT